MAAGKTGKKGSPFTNWPGIEYDKPPGGGYVGTPPIKPGPKPKRGGGGSSSGNSGTSSWTPPGMSNPPGTNPPGTNPPPNTTPPPNSGDYTNWPTQIFPGGGYTNWPTPAGPTFNSGPEAVEPSTDRFTHPNTHYTGLRNAFGDYESDQPNRGITAFNRIRSYFSFNRTPATSSPFRVLNNGKNRIVF